MKKRFSLYTLPFAALFVLPEFLSGAAFVLAKRGLTEARVFGIRCLSCLIAGLLLAIAISLFEQKFEIKKKLIFIQNAKILFLYVVDMNE